MKSFVIFCLAISLSACTSVPLTTMFKLSNMESGDIAKIPANELRVRLTLDDPIKLTKQKVRLELKFEYKDNQSDKFEFDLESGRGVREFTKAGWFNSKQPRRSYEFKLARIAQLEFSNFQKSMIERKPIEKYFWTVYYYLAPHKQSQATIDVELKLSNQEQYFYLIEGAPVNVN